MVKHANSNPNLENEVVSGGNRDGEYRMASTPVKKFRVGGVGCDMMQSLYRCDEGQGG